MEWIQTTSDRSAGRIVYKAGAGAGAGVGDGDGGKVTFLTIDEKGNDELSPAARRPIAKSNINGFNAWMRGFIRFKKNSGKLVGSWEVVNFFFFFFFFFL